MGFRKKIWRASGAFLSFHTDLIIIVAYRTLADIDDRGKLNIAEFHVAMGLIYRRT